MTSWHPRSWQRKSLAQQPDYPSTEALQQTLAELRRLPPLVTVPQVEKLKRQLAAASRGECFVLQGGDCAESFVDCNPRTISSKLNILMQMSLVLVHGLQKPVVRIGRIAGQYAKPRSTPEETRGAVSLPAYRGDLINGLGFSAQERQPDPKRLLQGYGFASLTLNYLRSLLENEFSDLRNIDDWELEFLSHSQNNARYQAIVADIKRSLAVLNGWQNSQSAPLTGQAPDLFTCHEALHLPYEQALTREANGKWYNLSTHLPWIGMRTAQPDSAHVEYARGIANPVALKVGPQVTADKLLELCELLNTNNEPGRLTLITRFGRQHIGDALPDLIDAVKSAQKNVLWVCDPMHGNTQLTNEGIKTRHFDDIVSELTQAIRIHRQCGSQLGGVHFEMTGDNVTECTGGARGLTELDLKRAYRSPVDPRLNAEQALEMALQLVALQSPAQP